MTTVSPSICRICTAHCPVLVTVEDGVVTAVNGDREAPLFEGYTCPKGRALPAIHAHPGRLMHSLRRTPDGSHESIGSDQAIVEIADRLADIVERHGPESVAMYIGSSNVPHPTLGRVAGALLQAIGSTNAYSAATIDQPGMMVADAYHGVWMGGRTSFDSSDVWLFVGTNPIISKQFLEENPARRLSRAIARGTKIIVIDPRRTETARRAHLHLQPRPGHDAVLVAGLLHLILRQGWVDTDFVATHIEGLEALRTALAPFTPEQVSARADVPVDQLLEAARLIGTARRGGAGSGTGASMSSPGPLVPYLILCLMSVRGFWAREGDPIERPNVLLPPNPARAQAFPPYPAMTGRRMRVRGLEQSVAGLPTGALAEEILTPGPGQIRALFNIGGSPATAWPDQRLARRALEDLELFVTTEVEYSPTARLADYVVATKLAFETPGTTQGTEAIKYFHFGYGFALPFAKYTPTIVEPPAGADVIEDWQLYYRVGQRLGLQLDLVNLFGVPGGYLEAPIDVVPLDMEREPTTDDLLELMCRGSHVPLEEVKRYPHGHVFEHLMELKVDSADPGNTARLDIGNATALTELAACAQRPVETTPERPLLLVPRRENRVMNTYGRTVPGLMGTRPYNPAFMHPEDIAELGFGPGDVVEIRSEHGAVVGVLEGDAELRHGLLSMSHGFGGNPGEEEDPLVTGANTNRLLSSDVRHDPITGQPAMGSVPVSIGPVAADETEDGLGRRQPAVGTAVHPS
jgi:anaerobic selenocysteine-containing dehydrogenase